MLTKNARQALELIGLIAAVPSHQYVTIVLLAQHMGVSVSYLETIFKKLLKGGVVKSHRGPGGGYQLAQAIGNMHAWDVVSLFCEPMPDMATVHACPGQVSLNDLDASYREKAIEVLKNAPLGLVRANKWLLAPESKSKAIGFHLKPLPKPMLPHAPSSIFDLHAFLEMDLV